MAERVLVISGCFFVSAVYYDTMKRVLNVHAREPLPPGAHIAVVGAGLEGVTSAYELSRAGYRVTVLDKALAPSAKPHYARSGAFVQSQPYLKTSGDSFQLFAGKVLQGVLPSWAGAAGNADDAAAAAAADFAVGSDVLGHASFWRWVGNRAYCSIVANASQKQRDLLELLEHSQDTMVGTVDREGFEPPACSSLLLQAEAALCVHTDADAFQTAAAGLRKRTGQRILSESEAQAAEPALAALSSSSGSTQVVHGVIQMPQHQASDSGTFTALLARRCKDEYGVVFEYGKEVIGLDLDVTDGLCRSLTIESSSSSSSKTANSGEEGEGVRSDFACDAVVLANGNGTRDLMRGVGVTLPIMPVRSYTVSGPSSGDTSKCPARSSVFKHKAGSAALACSRVGEGGKCVQFDAVEHMSFEEDAAGPTKVDAMVQRLFPDAIADVVLPAASTTKPASSSSSGWFSWSSAQPVQPLEDTIPSTQQSRLHRAWVHPTTADTLPITSATHIPNLFLNTGHGGNQGAFAHGSAVMVSDLVQARRSKIPQRHLDVKRFFLF